MSNFTLTPQLQDLRQRVRDFVQNVVIPREHLESDTDGLPEEHLKELHQEAKQANLWAPHLPKEWGGLELSTSELCHVFQQAGRSPVGPLALHCSAPDEGNMHLLLVAGTEDQKQKYLTPLARAECRSCFAMTEPAPGAGSDASMLLTRAIKQRDRWVLNGHKWFTTGAKGSSFAIVAAVTDPDVPARNGVSLFLVETDTPGFEIVRNVPVMGTEGQGGHCEIKLTDCVVAESQMLGALNEGFRLLQARLGPARLTHCMRWLGAAQRGLEIAMEYAKERTAFGQALNAHQGIQWMLADSWTELKASHLMVLEAAWQIQQGEKARLETSACKVFVAETVGRVLDRAMQICGAKGYSRDLILERLVRDARAFRIYDGPSEVHRMVITRELLKSSDGLWL